MNENKLEEIQPSDKGKEQEIVVSEEELEEIDHNMRWSYHILREREIIKTPQEFKELYENGDIGKILKYTTEHVLKYINKENLGCVANFCQTSQEFRKLCENRDVVKTLERAKKENIECVIDLCQTPDDFIKLCEDKNVMDVLKYAKEENLRHVINLCQIKILQEFERICRNENVKYVLNYARDKNLKYVTNLYGIESLMEFEKICENENIIYTLNRAEEKNLGHIINLCKTTREFEEICENENTRNVLGYAKEENLRHISNLYQIKTTREFEEICENENIKEILHRACEKNLEFAIEKNIINRYNIAQAGYEALNKIDEITNIDQPNEQEIKFLQKLFNQCSTSANNALETIIESENIKIEQDSEDIFEMLDKLGNISPIIFEKFKNLNLEERDSYIEEIRDIKKEMFKNKPIDTQNNPDEMAELIYLSYQPVGMSFEEVKELLLELEDRTDDLKDYQFPEDGYNIEISASAEKVLKKGKEIDFETIDYLKEVIKNATEKTRDEKEEYLGEISINLDKVAKASPTLDKNGLSSLLSILKNDSIASLSEKQIDRNNINLVYNYLSEFKEVLGVVFKDNFKEDLKQLLDENPEIFERIKNVLSNEKREGAFLNSIKKDFKNSEILDDKYWQNLDAEKIANLLSVFIEKKIIKRERNKISKELNKIEEKEKRSGTRRKQKEEIKLKAYVSKNVGSFFAKASAGICTADDIELFNRPNHFHINLAEDIGNNNEIIRGNNQAYIIEDDEEKSLLLRGINPNSSFLYQVDEAVLCEKIIEVAKQFKRDNGLKAVYLSEQLEDYHALSNRETTFGYLDKKYLKKENEKKINFEITEDAEISKMYKVD